MYIKNIFALNAELAEPKYAHGGYPKYFWAADGEPLSFDAVRDNAGLVRDAIIAGPGTGNDQWRVVGLELNWEDETLICAYSGQMIECAYPSDKNDPV